jgi:hypothetical protein
MPLFIKNLIKWEASEMEDRLPSARYSGSIGGGFQIIYLFLPDGAPSFDTISSSETSKQNILLMCCAGLASVALQEIKQIRRSDLYELR